MADIGATLQDGPTLQSVSRAARGAVAKAGVLTKALAGLTVAGFFLQLAAGDAFRRQFALVPAKVIPKFWMLETAAFVELNPAQLVLNVPLILFAGNLLEPLWGIKDLLDDGEP